METFSINVCDNQVIEFSIIPPGMTAFLSPSSHFRKSTKNISGIPSGKRRWSITRPFAVSRKIITRKVYSAVVGGLGPWTTGRKDRFRDNDESPANFVSYGNAMSFCKVLSDKVGKSINLPSELMYEYYASGGNSNDFYWSTLPYDSDECIRSNLKTIQRLNTVFV